MDPPRFSPAPPAPSAPCEAPPPQPQAFGSVAGAAAAVDDLFRQIRAEDGWRMLVLRTMMADRIYAVGSVLRWHSFERALGNGLWRPMLDWCALQVGTHNLPLVLAPRSPLRRSAEIREAWPIPYGPGF